MLLGIDIGTSSAKAIVFDPQKNMIHAVASKEYAVNRPQPQYAEQNPEDWWQAVVEITQNVLETAGTRDIRAIGITGQMHGTVFLGADGSVKHPAVIWADQRSANSLPEMLQCVSPERYTAVTGTMPAAGFMAATLYWFAKHNPVILEQTQHVILPKDYIRFRLTGTIGTEVSDAASTALFDVNNYTWSDDLIADLQLDKKIFTAVDASTATIGHLTEVAATELGLPSGISVAAGCADQPAQALANGLVDPGIASVTTGTGGQIFAPVELPQDADLPVDQRLHVFNHAVPGQIYVLGAMLSAGSALRWLRDVVGLADQPDAYQRFSAEAAQVSPGSDGLIFLPYLVGERTPHMDPMARGAFVGLTAYHTRAHMARAVMEGVTYALRQTLEAVTALAGEVNKVIIAGGGAESDVWAQIQADVFGLPLQRTLQSEQTCVGAAMLAGVASGDYENIQDAVMAVAKYGEVIEPNESVIAAYSAYYDQFAELYPRLKDDFHLLSTRNA